MLFLGLLLYISSPLGDGFSEKGPFRDVNAHAKHALSSFLYLSYDQGFGESIGKKVYFPPQRAALFLRTEFIQRILSEVNVRS